MNVVRFAVLGVILGILGLGMGGKVESVPPGSAATGRVAVWVKVKNKRQTIPARVIILDAGGMLTKISNVKGNNVAVRTGVLYTRGDGALFEVPPGTYQLRAMKGMEWSLGKQEVKVTEGKTVKATLWIERVVDTKGFVAADTHIHTRTYSGHGDATITERMITIAGEGIELAIATDHNHNTDYIPVQKKTNTGHFFTAVRGNEVTTSIGHYNSFPFTGKNKPDSSIKDLVKLVAAIRAKGAKVVILNHPHWPNIGKGTFAQVGLDPVSGDRSSGTDLTFDAIELINSLVKSDDPMPLVHDWMGLLNRGEWFSGVGASDSHTVSGAVGQGRTYVKSSTDIPSRINVAEMVSSFQKGAMSVSLGIFGDVKVNGRYGMGDTVKLRKGKGKDVEVEFRVACAEWVHPRTAMLYVNGRKIAEKDIPWKKDTPTDQKIHFKLPVPEHDAYLVCVARGDPSNLPGWPENNPYTLAVTNPVYLDVDGDRKIRSVRELAADVLKGTGDDPGAITGILNQGDEVIGVQIISILSDRSPSLLDRLKPDKTLHQELIERMKKKAGGHRH